MDFLYISPVFPREIEFWTRCLCSVSVRDSKCCRRISFLDFRCRTNPKEKIQPRVDVYAYTRGNPVTNIDSPGFQDFSSLNPIAPQPDALPAQFFAGPCSPAPGGKPSLRTIYVWRCGDWCGHRFCCWWIGGNGYAPSSVRDRRYSLVTTIAIFQIVCAPPEWLYFAFGLHSENKLSIDLAIYLAVLCVVTNVVLDVLFWATVMEPIRKRNFNRN